MEKKGTGDTELNSSLNMQNPRERKVHYKSDTKSVHFILLYKLYNSSIKKATKASSV